MKYKRLKSKISKIDGLPYTGGVIYQYDFLAPQIRPSMKKLATSPFFVFFSAF